MELPEGRRLNPYPGLSKQRLISDKLLRFVNFSEKKRSSHRDHKATKQETSILLRGEHWWGSDILPPLYRVVYQNPILPVFSLPKKQTIVSPRLALGTL